MLKTKSVYSPIKSEDGIRILVTRFRGRGLPKSMYHAWMPSLGPSEQLLKLAQVQKITWSEFSRGYTKELFLDGPVDKKCKTIKNHGQKFTLRLVKQLAKTSNVTLMCHCDEDQEYCHRHILKKLILSKKI
jgi:uncharacterized protein YeaO (DUF488 family)